MNLIIGSHVSYNNKSQLLGSVKEALSYKANTFMFYTGAPQNTNRSVIEDSLTMEAYKLMKENNIALEKVIVHAPYIVNLANFNNFDFSVSFLINEVERCSTLGIKYLVLHPGSAVNCSREEAINNISKGLNLILDNDYDVTILLETMAGKGNEMGKTFEELKAIIDKIKHQDKIGVCIDTCHLNDAGYDMSKFDIVLDNFDKVIGINKIGCIHVNDSKNEISSHKDRHENIGFGTIGFDNLIKIIYNDRLESIPKILETPYVTKDDVNLSQATNQIELFDTGVAFLSGMMIIPAVFVFLGTEGMASGPSLTFISLPKVFEAMGGLGRIIGIAFFLMLAFAALTSCVSVMETLVANCMEIFHKTRQQMCIMVGIYSLVTAILICLGYNVLYFDLTLPNGTSAQLLDLMDYISNSFLMPFISLLTSILIGWIVGPKWITDEVVKNGESFPRAGLYSFMIRYVVPVIMLVLFLVSTGFMKLNF